MAYRLLIILFTASLSFGCAPGQSSDANENNEIQETYNLKSDFAKYNGFYTSVESTDGHLSSDNLPADILSFKSLEVESVTLDYLMKLKDGYLLTFSVHFKGAKTLVVSTLNSEYYLVDYRIFTNGLGSTDVTQDTIAIPSYHNNGVTVQIMHPNRLEEPEFKVDGIKKVEMIIRDDLRLIDAG